MDNAIIPVSDIQNMIFSIRGVQVMIDRDLAKVYEVETKVLNQAVKRNLLRFPEAFRFQLTDTERNELVTNCDRFQSLKHSTTNPYVFTEQGVSMLSAVLRSDTAISVSIQIINAFVEMGRYLQHIIHNFLENHFSHTLSSMDQILNNHKLSTCFVGDLNGRCFTPNITEIISTVGFCFFREVNSSNSWESLNHYFFIHDTNSI